MASPNDKPNTLSRRSSRLGSSSAQNSAGSSSSLLSRTFSRLSSRKGNTTTSATYAPETQRKEAPASSPPTYAESTTRADLSTREDPFKFLTWFDTVFLIDDSASMTWSAKSADAHHHALPWVVGGGRAPDSRWDETRAALAALVPICTSHDDDGVDVYFLNHKSVQKPPPSGGSNNGAAAAANGYYNIRSPDAVSRIFEAVRPHGGTPTGPRLDDILCAYLRAYKREQQCQGQGLNNPLKPLNVIVVTDGEPSPGLEPDAVLAKVARALDDMLAPAHQVGVQFFQVGDDAGAARALQRLDDLHLEQQGQQGPPMRDIVDTATFDADGGAGSRGGGGPALTAEGILKVVLGAVNKRWDEKPTARR
ncbi:hypothetical protein GGR56DRAFT_525785 [Xylariaceae sp. FL0804]|nr:hypothetical protein GGR56DRAFT_525785 [Xylariaceae sp. FL0804]